MVSSTKSPPNLAEIRARRAEILALAQEYGASNIRIFGSVARGEAKLESDVDFLVTFPEEYKLLDHAGFLMGLKDLLGYAVDVSIEANLREEYQDSVRKDAVPL